MLDLELIAVVSAENTVQSSGHLFPVVRKKVINQLINQLLPLAEEGYVPACKFISEHSTDHAQKVLFTRKLASLGDVPAMKFLFDYAIKDGEPIEHALDYLARYAQYSSILYHIPLENTIPEEIGTLERLGLWTQENAQLFKERRDALIVTPEDIQAAIQMMNTRDYQHAFIASTQEDNNFLKAVLDNNCVYVQNYLANGGNPFIQHPDRLGSALHLAIGLTAEPNRFEMLKILIQAYQRYHFCLNHYVAGIRMSPVGYAAESGYFQAMEMLFEAGVDPHYILWEWEHHTSYIIQGRRLHPHRAILLDRYLNLYTNTLKLRVLPIIQHKNEPITIDFDDTTYNVDSSAMIKLIYESAFVYKISTYSRTLNSDYCLFELSLKAPAVEYLNPFLMLLGLSLKKLEGFLAGRNILCEFAMEEVAGSLSLLCTIPRDAFSATINFLLESHEKHVYAMFANHPISELGFLNEANPLVQAHVNRLLQMDIPNTRDVPMLFDYDYTLLMKPFVTEEEKKHYQNYCTIRFWARFFAAALDAQWAGISKPLLLEIASMLGDYAIHNKDESRNIAQDNFQRLPATTYTPRFFLPASLVNALPNSMPSPKPS